MAEATIERVNDKLTDERQKIREFIDRELVMRLQQEIATIIEHQTNKEDA